MAGPETRCANCRKILDIETCHWDRSRVFSYCDPMCQKLRERAYDRWVDPLGWYSNPNRVATHD